MRMRLPTTTTMTASRKHYEMVYERKIMPWKKRRDDDDDDGMNAMMDVIVSSRCMILRYTKPCLESIVC